MDRNIVFYIALIAGALVFVACGGHSHEHGDHSHDAAAITLEMVDTPVDPVCKMNVEGLAIADTMSYQGKTYPFCNANCKAKFEAEPAAYVVATDDDSSNDHDGGDHDDHEHEGHDHDGHEHKSES